MKEIRNVILCGLGAVGSVYADKLQHADCDFRVLADKVRVEKYKKNPVTYNNKPLNLKYILPDDKSFKADLIIITTKVTGLKSALDEMKNFVKNDTIIIPLLNGVKSEQIVAEAYGKEKVLYAYFIGHSAVRTAHNTNHDGVNTLVFGSDNKKDEQTVETLKNFFKESNINYDVPQDIKHSLWLKFMLNVCANPITALFRMSFGEMLNNTAIMTLAVKIMKEVQAIAKAEGINNTEIMIEETLANLKAMAPNGRTSMLQDVEAGRKTEIDIFAGDIVRLGKKHNIQTPYCEFLTDAFNVIHEQMDKSVI